MDNKKRINLWIDLETLSSLKLQAYKAGITMTALINSWIEESALKNLEIFATKKSNLHNSKVINFYLDFEKYNLLTKVALTQNIDISTVIRSLISMKINSNIPKVSYTIVSKNAYFDACDLALDDSKSMEMLFAFNSYSFYKYFDLELDLKSFIPKRMSQGVNAKLLTTYDSLSADLKVRDRQFLRETKYLPFGDFSNKNIIISDKKVLFLERNYPSASVFEDEAFAASFRNVFYNLWKYTV